MSREISFRAWDEKSIEMWSMDYLLMRGDTQEMSLLDEILNNIGDTAIYHLMQYIDRKDKNGIKIYEGDIVISSGTKGVVAWFNNLTWDSGGSPHSGFYCEAWFDYRESGELSYHSSFEDCEVIGNIYENPYLLGDEK